MNQTALQLLQDALARPDDFRAKNLLADFLYDQQDDEYHAVAWQVQNRKRPYRHKDGRASWFDQDKVAKILGDPQSDLPHEVFERLEGAKEANHKTYASAVEAELAFVRAFVRTLN